MTSMTFDVILQFMKNMSAFKSECAKKNIGIILTLMTFYEKYVSS